MLYRLGRSVKRKDSSFVQFTRRIPTAVLPRAAGLKLTIPLGNGEFHHLTISPGAKAIRFSLRTRDPSEAKSRYARALAYLEEVWRSLQADKPLSLNRKQAVALSGELYRAWASERPAERTIAIIHTPDGWRPDRLQADEEKAAFVLMVERLNAGPELPELESLLGPYVDRLLLAKGISAVDEPSRFLLLEAFAQALRDAFAARARQAAGNYRPDANAERFPAWEKPEAEPEVRPSPAAASVSLKGLVEDWWKEAQATGRKLSTYESYRHTMERLVGYLGHDDAARLTPESIIGFKDHRLASINPRTNKPISAKTVKDSDLAGLKTVFGWAVSNRRMASNPAAGLTIKLGKPAKLRSKGFTDAEAKALLKAADAHQRGSERPKTFAAKRWVPWLCAYTGSRVGEMVQLRKQDIRKTGDHWIIHITPEAGTVKTDAARDVVMHEHLVAKGFPAFVQSSPAGYLFITPKPDGTTRGPWRTRKNDLVEAARQTVKDPGVKPNHGWRHRFKTVGMEAGIDHRIMDAIQGQRARTVSETYGDVTLTAQALAMAKFPRVKLEG